MRYAKRGNYEGNVDLGDPGQDRSERCIEGSNRDARRRQRKTGLSVLFAAVARPHSVRCCLVIMYIPLAPAARRVHDGVHRRTIQVPRASADEPSEYAEHDDEGRETP